MDDIDYDSDPYWNGGQRLSPERVQDYECQTCGYTPTRYELNQGSCPHCAAARRAAKGVKP